MAAPEASDGKQLLKYAGIPERRFRPELPVRRPGAFDIRAARGGLGRSGGHAGLAPLENQFPSITTLNHICHHRRALIAPLYLPPMKILLLTASLLVSAIIHAHSATLVVRNTNDAGERFVAANNPRSQSRGRRHDCLPNPHFLPGLRPKHRCLHHRPNQRSALREQKPGHRWRRQKDSHSAGERIFFGFSK